MGVNLAITTETWAGSDQTWIGSQEGTLSNRNVTLDLSKFDFASDFPNGMIPSGVVLGKITASGLYGPYDDSLSTGVQTATGILFTDVDVKAAIADQMSTTVTGSVLTAMFIRGVVIEANLPTNHGLDANGKTDLKFIQFI